MNIHSATVLAGRNGSFNGNRGAENAYSPASVTGRDIAHSHRTASARAGLAAQLVLGEVKLIKPTITQVASIARISIPYVRLGLELTQGTRTHLAAGEITISEAARCNGLLAAWLAATAEEKAAFGVAVGVNEVWDEVIAPSI